MKKWWVIALCVIVSTSMMQGCSSRLQTLRDVNSLLHQRYVAPKKNAPSTTNAGITSVSLNKNGWIIVKGEGAGSSDKLYVSIGGEEQVPMDLRASSGTGAFYVTCPNYLLAASPKRELPLRLIIGPPGYAKSSQPSMRRFVWEGTVSLNQGAIQD